MTSSMSAVNPPPFQQAADPRPPQQAGEELLHPVQQQPAGPRVSMMSGRVVITNSILHCYSPSKVCSLVQLFVSKLQFKILVDKFFYSFLEDSFYTHNFESLF